MRESLAAYGDDGSAVRHVIHFAYPREGADLSLRPQIIAALQDRGFGVSDAKMQNGLVFEHHRSVAPNGFDAFTAELEAWFSAGGWEYDGWECAVVPPGKVD